MPTRYPMTRTSGLVLLALLVTAWLVGSCFDQSISHELAVKTNAFGRFFAAYGAAPAFLAAVVAGALLVQFGGWGQFPPGSDSARPTQRKAVRASLTVIGVALTAVALGCLIVVPAHYWELPLWGRTVVALILVGATWWATRWVAAEADPRLALRVALILIAVVIAEMLVVTLLKVGWDRPRPRLALWGEGQFAPWWAPGIESEADLLAGGVPSDEFKSLPSAHTANAAVAMALPLLSLLRPTWARLAPLLLWIGALWTAAVALSRVVLGAHYVTDTALGAALTLGLLLLISHLVLRRRWFGPDPEGLEPGDSGPPVSD